MELSEGAWHRPGVVEDTLVVRPHRFFFLFLPFTFSFSISVLSLFPLFHSFYFFFFSVSVSSLSWNCTLTLDSVISLFSLVNDTKHLAS